MSDAELKEVVAFLSEKKKNIRSLWVYTTDFESDFISGSLVVTYGFTSSWLLAKSKGVDAVYMQPAGSVLHILFGMFLVFMFAPVVLLVLLSFNAEAIVRLPVQALSLRWYAASLSNPSIWQSVATSLQVAACAAVLAVIVAVPAAFVMVRGTSALRLAVAASVVMPLIMPGVVTGVSQLLLLMSVGIPRSRMALVLGHATLALPYATLIIVPIVARLNRTLEEAAADLGAGRAAMLRTIVLPVIAPALLSALLVSFALSFDEVAIAGFLLGNDTTFPVYLLSQLRLPAKLPEALAVAVFAALFSLALFTLADLTMRSSGVGRRLKKDRSA